MLWNTKELQQKIPKLAKSQWQQERIIKSAFVIVFIIKSISTHRKSEGVKISGCRQPLLSWKLAFLRVSGTVKKHSATQKFHSATSEISTFLTAKISHTGKTQRTCWPCFMLIYLIPCLLGRHWRKKSCYLTLRGHSKWWSPITPLKLYPHFNSHPLTAFLAVSVYLGFLCQAANLKHLLEVGKGGERKLRSSKLIKYLYLSSLLYEICWGFEYLPLSTHINVKVGLKPPSKWGWEIHWATVLVPQVCDQIPEIYLSRSQYKYIFALKSP